VSVVGVREANHENGGATLMVPPLYPNCRSVIFRPLAVEPRGFPEEGGHGLKTIRTWPEPAAAASSFGRGLAGSAALSQIDNVRPSSQ
jgi:hypothetical protein